MKIVLNDQLEKLQLRDDRRGERFEDNDEIYLRDITNIGTRDAKLKVVRSSPNLDVISNSGMIHNISAAYSSHWGVEINPHDFWYIVLTQIAEHIKENGNMYHDLFVKKNVEGRQMITVQSGMDVNIVDQFIDKLNDYIPGGAHLTELFLPDLSTHTEMSRMSCAAAFCDTAQTYYDYGMFLCGISAISLKGTQQDWLLMQHNANKLVDIIYKEYQFSDLIPYLTQVGRLFGSIANTFDVVDLNFWLDIYTHKNVGSGWDLKVDGWIKQLYLKNDGLLKSFHATYSTFPVKDLKNDEMYYMRYGVYGASIVEERFLQSHYDCCIFLAI